MPRNVRGQDGAAPPSLQRGPRNGIRRTTKARAGVRRGLGPIPQGASGRADQRQSYAISVPGVLVTRTGVPPARSTV
jgi:hypothetical protein